MTISYPRALITTPGIRANEWRLDFLVDKFEPEKGPRNITDKRGGEQWQGTYILPPMSTAQARAWKAWFATMHGSVKTFLGYDPDARDPSGVANTVDDAPVVNGGGQTGTSLSTVIWRASGTGLLLPGDYFQIGSGATAELKTVTEQVDSNPGSVATINFEPPIRTSPGDTTSIVFNDPVGVFRLRESVSWDSNEFGVHQIAFDVREAI